MGYDLHVVRTENWADSRSNPISKADVDRLIMADDSLAWSTTDYVDMSSDDGSVTRYYLICWKGEPTFWWYRSEITCKNPDDSQILKLLEIAKALGAMLVGDDGERVGPSMGGSKLQEFIALLDAQMSGDPDALPLIRDLSISTADGYCLYNLWAQWKQAFSYQPGRTEALAAIRSAAIKVNAFETDDTAKLFAQPEWSNLVALRGPAECILRRSCVRCGHDYAVVGTSGFLDMKGLVCDTCGAVHFKSTYDDAPSPPCRCGAKFPELQDDGCPQCHEKAYRSNGETSPYEYFATHRFTRVKPHSS